MNILTAAQYEAAYNDVLPPTYTEINDDNLVVPIDITICQVAVDLRKSRKSLAYRLLMAVHYWVCRSGPLQGEVPANLVADWLWGLGAKPRHWRSSLKRAMERVMHRMVFENGGKAIEISLNGANVAYGVDPGFFGSLAPMVKDGRLKLLRRINTDGKATLKQIAHMRQTLGASVEECTDGEIKQEIAAEAARRVNARTLSSLGRQHTIWMIFMPAVLGVPAICTALGGMANGLAANRTRRYKVDLAKVPAFSGDQKIVCPLLNVDMVYAAFAANDARRGGAHKNGGDKPLNDRRGRGYLLSYWLKQCGFKEGCERKLLQRWINAAGPLQLTVVGIDRQNKFYSLNDMLAAPVDLLEKLHVRVYARLDWQKRWTKVFGMNTGAAVATDGSGAKPKPAEIGDLRHIKALVKEKGVRAMASAINLDPGNLSRYINARGGLAPVKAAALRQHLFETLPLGGPEIAPELSILIDQYPGNLGWVLAYRRLLCWSVVPMKPGTREGCIKWKPYQTTLPSEAEIIRWWTWWPDAGIGLILGPLSRVLAIDVDNAEADQALLDLLGDYPNCPRQLSGGYSVERPWKRHFFFQHPTDIQTGAKAEPLGKGLEFRGNRGLLILTPSVSRNGSGKYDWGEAGYAIWEKALPPVPEKVRQLLISNAKPVVAPQVKQAPVIVETSLPNLGYKGRRFSIPTRAFLTGQVQRGERNDRLFAAAREMRDYGVPKEVATPTLLKSGQSAGLDRDEILRTIISAYSRQTVP